LSIRVTKFAGSTFGVYRPWSTQFGGRTDSAAALPEGVIAPINAADTARVAPSAATHMRGAAMLSPSGEVSGSRLSAQPVK
jgi:hypothetical protein